MTDRVRWVIAGTLLAAALAGCEDSKPAPARSAPEPRVPVVVVHDDGSLPRRCDVRTTVSRVLAFESAFNRGDGEALDALVADPDHFQWYSVTDGGNRTKRGFTADGKSSAGQVSPPDQRPELLRYFTARHRRGERIRLLEIQLSKVPPHGWFPNIAYDVVGFTFTFRRDAADFAALGGANRLGGGKAAFGCGDGRLLAWSMGLDASHAPPRGEQRLCRKGRSRVRAASRTRRVIACTGP